MAIPAEFVPRPYQANGRDFFTRVPRGNYYADMGLGKTATILALIKALDLDDVLIVAPIRVAHEVWPREMAKWRQFQDLDIVPIRGTPDERSMLMLAPPRISTINYEQLIWLVNLLGEHWPFKTVIADESTRLRGFRTVKGTKRSNALSQTAHTRVERWINLTGLPNPKDLTDLWGPQWFVDGGESLGRSYSAFLQRWFYYEAAGGSSPYKKLKMFPSAKAEIESRIRKTTLSVRAKDWFDLEEPFENVVWVSLPDVARAPYRSMERQFYAELEKGTVTAANCAVRSGKLLQFASGAVYHADGSWSDVHDEKIEALRSIIEETNGANLLVVYQFRHELARLKKAFPSGVEIAARGSIDAWNAGKIRLLWCHPAQAGHGLNLQDGGHHIVYMSPTWDLELHAQVLERIGPVRQMQSGYDRLVYVHHVIARDTLDVVVKRRREQRADMVESLLEAMKDKL
jgi:SNF2 domain-containing protein